MRSVVTVETGEWAKRLQGIDRPFCRRKNKGWWCSWLVVSSFQVISSIQLPPERPCPTRRDRRRTGPRTPTRRSSVGGVRAPAPHPLFRWLCNCRVLFTRSNTRLAPASKIRQKFRFSVEFRRLFCPLQRRNFSRTRVLLRSVEGIVRWGSSLDCDWGYSIPEYGCDDEWRTSALV